MRLLIILMIKFNDSYIISYCRYQNISSINNQIIFKTKVQHALRDTFESEQ